MKSNTKVYICSDVLKIREIHSDTISDLAQFAETFEIINAMSIDLYRQYAQGYPPSIIELKNWHPDCIGKDYQHIMDLELSQEDIQYAQARQFGYKSWQEVIEKSTSINYNFEKAVDHLIMGELKQLKELLINFPNLLQSRSNYNHEASLIHYIAANGVECYRQITPINIVEATQLLLDMGASQHGQHNIYGGNCTLIDLIKTSAHPNEAGVAEQLIAILK